VRRALTRAAARSQVPAGVVLLVRPRPGAPDSTRRSVAAGSAEHLKEYLLDNYPDGLLEPIVLPQWGSGNAAQTAIESPPQWGSGSEAPAATEARATTAQAAPPAKRSRVGDAHGGAGVGGEAVAPQAAAHSAERAKAQAKPAHVPEPEDDSYWAPGGDDDDDQAGPSAPPARLPRAAPAAAPSAARTRPHTPSSAARWRRRPQPWPPCPLQGRRC